MGRDQKKTFTHSHLSWSSNILYHFLHLLQSIASSLFNLRTWLSFATTSVHVLFCVLLDLEPSASYFTQSLLFATQARTIATCFAAVPRLCHLFLISVSVKYLEISLNATHPADLSNLCWLKFHLFLPARHYANAGTNYNPLSVSVSVCHKSEF